MTHSHRNRRSTAALLALLASAILADCSHGAPTLPALIQAETTLASAATDIVNAIYKSQLAAVNLRYAVGTILQ